MGHTALAHYLGRGTSRGPLTDAAGVSTEVWTLSGPQKLVGQHLNLACDLHGLCLLHTEAPIDQA